MDFHKYSNWEDYVDWEECADSGDPEEIAKCVYFPWDNYDGGWFFDDEDIQEEPIIYRKRAEYIKDCLINKKNNCLYEFPTIRKTIIVEDTNLKRIQANIVLSFGNIIYNIQDMESQSYTPPCVKIYLKSNNKLKFIKKEEYKKESFIEKIHPLIFYSEIKINDNKDITMLDVAEFSYVVDEDVFTLLGKKLIKFDTVNLTEKSIKEIKNVIHQHSGLFNKCDHDIRSRLKYIQETLTTDIDKKIFQFKDTVKVTKTDEIYNPTVYFYNWTDYYIMHYFIRHNVNTEHIDTNYIKHISKYVYNSSQKIKRCSGSYSILSLLAFLFLHSIHIKNNDRKFTDEQKQHLITEIKNICNKLVEHNIKYDYVYTYGSSGDFLTDINDEDEYDKEYFVKNLFCNDDFKKNSGIYFSRIATIKKKLKHNKYNQPGV